MRTTLMALAVLAGCGQASVTGEHDSKLVRDRLWIDHIPRGQTDKVNIFVALTQRPRQGPIGIFEKVSAWEGHFEAFIYEQHGDEMRLVFPQSDDRETLTAKARTCTENGMDYCLELDGNKRGVKRYYSRKGWEIRDLAEVDALRLGKGLR